MSAKAAATKTAAAAAAPETAAHKAAVKAAAKNTRLKYSRPWPIFLPTAVAFVLLNYLAYSTETDVTGQTRILPEYVVEGATQRYTLRQAIAEGAVPGAKVPFNAWLFFEDDVMGALFRVGVKWFGSLFGIQAVCAAAWMIHIFELGICSRICFSCNASMGVTARNLFCVALGGFAQLVPLMHARDAWVAEVKAAAAASPADGEAAAEESKKDK